MTDLLTLAAVAEHLQISLRLAQKLSRAAEFAAEIRAGRRRLEEVPTSLIRYLDSGFPLPKRIGKSIRRVRRHELEHWLAR